MPLRYQKYSRLYICISSYRIMSCHSISFITYSVTCMWFAIPAISYHIVSYYPNHVSYYTDYYSRWSCEKHMAFHNQWFKTWVGKAYQLLRIVRFSYRFELQCLYSFSRKIGMEQYDWINISSLKCLLHSIHPTFLSGGIDYRLAVNWPLFATANIHKRLALFSNMWSLHYWCIQYLPIPVQ